jgi:hypothetical protein
MSRISRVTVFPQRQMQAVQLFVCLFVRSRTFTAVYISTIVRDSLSLSAGLLHLVAVDGINNVAQLYSTISSSTQRRCTQAAYTIAIELVQSC